MHTPVWEHDIPVVKQLAQISPCLYKVVGKTAVLYSFLFQPKPVLQWGSQEPDSLLWQWNYKVKVCSVNVTEIS